MLLISMFKISILLNFYSGTSSSSLPPGRTSADHESSNVKNEIREIRAKQGNNKKQATVSDPNVQ